MESSHGTEKEKRFRPTARVRQTDTRGASGNQAELTAWCISELLHDLSMPGGGQYMLEARTIACLDEHSAPASTRASLTDSAGERNLKHPSFTDGRVHGGAPY
ncbi:hypothetical protein PDE_03944 [Penicillium oxalicum 114-2]|uniref:Uncharacterized protein n=1 Tax=Penicillium oxalicum (strain 114-2 / CGMCC 5302) TaxID=933388 RepID=S8ASF5_PENO1|nr:hypothetical protein PDE_03944 [Penicillium oxalicum 114-2]